MNKTTVNKYAAMTSQEMFNDMLTDVHARVATNHMSDGVDPGEAVSLADNKMLLLEGSDWMEGQGNPEAF